jgi:hypothetical protein
MKEIMGFTGLPQEIISARLSELITQRFIKRIESGIYSAIPYRAGVYIEKIKRIYNKKSG